MSSVSLGDSDYYKHTRQSCPGQSLGINFPALPACCTHGQRGSGGQRQSLGKDFQVLAVKNLAHELGKLPTDLGEALTVPATSLLIECKASHKTLLHHLIGHHDRFLWPDF